MITILKSAFGNMSCNSTDATKTKEATHDYDVNVFDDHHLIGQSEIVETNDTSSNKWRLSAGGRYAVKRKNDGNYLSQSKEDNNKRPAAPKDESKVVVVPDQSVTTVKKLLPAANRSKQIKKWKQPPDKPRRPLCGYNIFFHLERDRLVKHGVNNVQLLESYAPPDTWSKEEVAAAAYTLVNRPKRKHVKVPGGSLSFKDLSNYIATKWKSTDGNLRQLFEQQASIITQDYIKKIEEWKESQTQTQKEEATNQPISSEPMSTEQRKRQHPPEPNEALDFDLTNPTLIPLNQRADLPLSSSSFSFGKSKKGKYHKERKDSNPEAEPPPQLLESKHTTKHWKTNTSPQHQILETQGAAIMPIKTRVHKHDNDEGLNEYAMLSSTQINSFETDDVASKASLHHFSDYYRQEQLYNPKVYASDSAIDYETSDISKYSRHANHENKNETNNNPTNLLLSTDNRPMRSRYHNGMNELMERIELGHSQKSSSDMIDEQMDEMVRQGLAAITGPGNSDVSSNVSVRQLYHDPGQQLNQFYTNEGKQMDRRGMELQKYDFGNQIMFDGNDDNLLSDDSIFSDTRPMNTSTHSRRQYDPVVDAESMPGLWSFEQQQHMTLMIERNRLLELRHRQEKLLQQRALLNAYNQELCRLRQQQEQDEDNHSMNR